jgi:hypothetical protein
MQPWATARAIWEADLVAGAVRDEMYLGNLGNLENDSYTFHLPDGSTVPDISGGIGNVAPAQSFATSTNSTITSQLTTAAQAAGLSNVQVSVMNAEQPEPVVIATTTSPSAVAQYATSVSEIFGGGDGTRVYEGEYLEVDDATSGTPVLIETGAYRTGHGQQWANPSYGGQTGLGVNPVPGG